MSFALRAISIGVLILALVSCGSESAGHTPAAPAAPAAQSVGVAVDPAATTVPEGSTARFAATVTGTANTAVTWDVVEPSGGAVDSTGLYTAPGAAGVFHVRATSVAAPAVSAQGTVTVASPVVVTVAPQTASVVVGGTVTFTATVANASNTSVVWSVAPSGCGTVTSAGVYTAPATAAACTVVATSQADPSKSASATVTVTAAPPPVVVTVTPSPAAVDACATLAFSATVTGTTNRAVTWSIQEGAAGGSITSAGVYTASSNAGSYHVVATSQADPTKSAVVTVTVSDRILSVAVSPQTIQLAPGGTQQFTATVTTTCGTTTSTSTVAATAAGQIVVR